MSLLGECLEWRGDRDPHGYGRKTIRGKNWFTHRLAWSWANECWGADGPKIPRGMCVLHRCDNPPCINPDHLFLGTQLDNIRDMYSKGKVRRPICQKCCQPMVLENLYFSYSDDIRHRACRRCALNRAKRRQHKLRIDKYARSKIV